MRIVLAGGTGLIGRVLTAELDSHGHEVVVLSRFPERAGELPSGVRVERWDARTADGWGHLASEAGAIVNLAGSNLAGEGFLPTRWTPERKRLIRESRVQAGGAIVEAVEAAKVKPGVVIQASGIGYYGFCGDELVTEGSPAGDDFLAQLAHRDWEPSTAAVEELGVRRAIIRTGAVLDSTEGALPRLVLPFRLFVGGPFGNGKQYMSWIHVQDEARAIRFLIEDERAQGPFNLVSPKPLTNAQFAHTLGRVLRRPSIVPVPALAMKLAFGEVASVLLEGQRAIPQRLLDLGFQFRFPEAEAALENLLG